LAVAWAIYEVGSTLYDIYDFGASLVDPCADWWDVGLGGGGLVLGAILPGGGYGKMLKGGKKLVKGGKSAKKISGVITGNFFGKTEKQILRNAPKEWKRVPTEIDGVPTNGWKLLDENNVERIRFMRPDPNSTQPWVHNQTGYWRRTVPNPKARGGVDYLDEYGDVVPRSDPNFEFKTHIPYSGVN